MFKRARKTGLTPEQFAKTVRVYGPEDQDLLDALSDAAASISGTLGISVGIGRLACEWLPDGAEWTTLCIPDRDNPSEAVTFLTPDGQYSLLFGDDDARGTVLADAIVNLSPRFACEPGPPRFRPDDKLTFIREFAAFCNRIPGMALFQTVWFEDPDTKRQYLAVIDKKDGSAVVSKDDYYDITDTSLLGIAKLVTDRLKEAES